MMQKGRARIGVVALVATLGAGSLTVALSSGSSHREAPSIALDPTADNTDVYAYTANDAQGSITLAANWIPLEDPAGGPNFFRFDDKADYYINIDNTGEGKADVRYKFKFKTKVRNKNSFLYALPGVTGFNDPKLNVVQTYSVTRLTYRKNGTLKRSRMIAKKVRVAPNNVGPKTIAPAVYSAISNSAIKSLTGGGKVFAGQRDDPFFVDLGAAFDAINLRNGTGNAGGGKDDLAGLNTHSVVLQVPEKQVTRNGKTVSGPTASNAVVGVWSSTNRQSVSVKRGKAKRKSVQVSRLGNPLVNELVIPLGRKDKFNRTNPDKDAQYGGSVVKPELAAVLNALFNLNIKETGRTDIVTALLTGVPGANQIKKNPPPTDTLKLNLGIPPNMGTPNRFGFIAGDNAGFPNGRRLADDVVDAELRVVGGYLIGTKLPLGDGVDQNDVPFLSAFPYLAPPHDGFNSDPKRFEPTHAPTPGNLP